MIYYKNNSWPVYIIMDYRWQKNGVDFIVLMVVVITFLRLTGKNSHILSFLCLSIEIYRNWILP